jgi:hypothetical protein
MAIYLSDGEIEELISEEKLLPVDYREKIIMRPKRGHSERELDIKGKNGNMFRLILRQSSLNPIDFSAILAWLPPTSGNLFRLYRYNGKSHGHTNFLESGSFYDFHIHRASERYQQAGLREDAYAEPTDRYQDLNGAICCLRKECGFRLPDETQPDLFESGGNE